MAKLNPYEYDGSAGGMSPPTKKSLGVAKDSPKRKPRAEPARLSNKALEPKMKNKPASELAEERDRNEGMSFAEGVREANASIGAGSGPAGRTFKSIMGGAAAGATLGEALSDLHQKRIQRGKPRKPSTLSELAASTSPAPPVTESIDFGDKRPASEQRTTTLETSLTPKKRKKNEESE